MIYCDGFFKECDGFLIIIKNLVNSAKISGNSIIIVAFFRCVCFFQRFQSLLKISLHNQGVTKIRIIAPIVWLKFYSFGESL